MFINAGPSFIKREIVSKIISKSRAKKCYEKVEFKERTLTENAFRFKDESWGRCNMVILR